MILYMMAEHMNHVGILGIAELVVITVFQVFL